MERTDIRASHAPSFWQKPIFRLASAGLAVLASGSACSDPGGLIHDAAGAKREAAPANMHYELPFKAGQNWYMTAPAHEDALSGGVKWAVTFTSEGFNFCPGARQDFEALAVAGGTVRLIPGRSGDPKDVLVELRHTDETTTVYKRLTNLQVVDGQQVETGVTLGSPSCLVKGHAEDADTPRYVGFDLARRGKFGQPIEIISWELGDFRVTTFGMYGVSGGYITAGEMRCGPEKETIQNVDTCGNRRNSLTGR